MYMRVCSGIGGSQKKALHLLELIGFLETWSWVPWKGATSALPPLLSHLSSPDSYFFRCSPACLLVYLRLCLISRLHFLNLLFLILVSRSSHLVSHHLAKIISLLLSSVRYTAKDHGLFFVLQHRFDSGLPVSELAGAEETCSECIKNRWRPEWVCIMEKDHGLRPWQSLSPGAAQMGKAFLRSE